MTAEEYVARHKEAFRTAFDFLNSHFPPGPDLSYWEKTASDVREANDKCNNKLAMELLIGVYNYLEDEWKGRYQSVETGA